MYKTDIFKIKIMEEWKDIPGYEGIYQISNLGNILSSYTNKMTKPSIDRFGYTRFSATKNKKQKTLRIHRLVAELFIENQYNLPQVNHIDGDKTNNSVSNLEWCNDSQNKTHAYSIGLMTAGNQYKKRIRKNLNRYK